MALRRSTRLPSQIHASEGAGMAPRRSPRLHSQTQASGDGAGETRRRSPLHPQILDPPGRIPPQRFDLGCSSDDYDLLDCRHGHVLVKNMSHTEVFVCDPITSEQRRLAVLPEFTMDLFNGDQGHVHGGCHSSPFKVVLMSMEKYDQPLASVYTSETGIWGTIIFPEVPCEISGKPVVLVRNGLYWLSRSDDILEFDLGEHSLILIRGPPLANDILFMDRQIIRAEHGVVGYVTFSYPRFQMWQRNVNGHGVATWVLWKTIEMHSIFKIPPQTEEAIRECDEADMLHDP